jgi:murein DD-endopeptidase MepM/ murein hydrolase activator NlpD
MNEKKENGNKKKKTQLNGEKRFYLFTAISCAVALVAIVVIAAVVSNAGKVDSPAANVNSNSTVNEPVDNPQEPEDEGNEPVGTLPEGMVAPVETVAVLNDYGFYHNKTLNTYYEHAGIDFTAAAGTEVMAVEKGTIESIYKDDVLLGTEIVVNHGNGLKTVYRFVTEAEGLKVGDTVEKGEVIATVAEATGNEYKDGAHLHFEIMQDGKTVDPALRLPLEEK